MLSSRIAASVVAAAIAGGGLAVPAAASPASAAVVLDRPGCRYRVVRVKTRLNVRAQPRGRIVDKLYPGDRTWGACKKAGKWRRVHGTDSGRRGHAFGHYLKKIGKR